MLLYGLLSHSEYLMYIVVNKYLLVIDQIHSLISFVHLFYQQYLNAFYLLCVC